MPQAQRCFASRAGRPAPAYKLPGAIVTSVDRAQLVIKLGNKFSLHEPEQIASNLVGECIIAY